MDSLDIIVPNSVFVNQSETYSIRFSYFTKEDADSLTRRTDDMLDEAVGRDCGVKVTPPSKRMMRVLGGFGTRFIRHARAHWHAEKSTWRILSISHLVCPLGSWPYAKRGEWLHRPHRPQNRHIRRSNPCIFSTRKEAMTEVAQSQERLRPLLWKRFLWLEEYDDPPGV
jgi:hypothetical protein